MRLIQYMDDAGRHAVAAGDGQHRRLDGIASTHALAQAAIAAGGDLSTVARRHLSGDRIDLDLLEREGRLLPPLDHPDDPAHFLVTGTGLSHLGSAEGRDQMHRDLAQAEALTDSRKMFKFGLEGGKPGPGRDGVQPEWFFKGDGSIVVPPGQPLPSPAFARDAGEEPEIVGLYVIGPDGAPWRVGWALGNEFSDHVTERENYLYLAHSKLRACSIGPELLVGDLPGEVRGVSRIRRDGAVAWERPFLSGEDHMCHSLENLECHHFKYALFRRPGDVHAHFLGTSTLSFTDGFRARAGDLFEIAAEPFGRPLRNPLAAQAAAAVTPRALR